MSPPPWLLVPAWFGYCHTGGGLGDKKNSCQAWGTEGIPHPIPAPDYLVCFRAILNFLLFGSVSGLEEESINMTPKVSVKKKKRPRQSRLSFILWQLFPSPAAQVC